MFMRPEAAQPSSSFSLWPAFPTPSHSANTEQGLGGETGIVFCPNLIPPQRSRLLSSPVTHLSLFLKGSFHPDLQARIRFLLAQESRAGPAILMNEYWELTEHLDLSAVGPPQEIILLAFTTSNR